MYVASGGTVGWAGAGVKTGASTHEGRWDGDAGHLMFVMGTPWVEAGAGGGGAYGAAGGGGSGAVTVAGSPCVTCRNVRRLAIAWVRSRTAVDNSAGERMGAGSAAGATCAAAEGAGGVSEVTATVAEGWPDDMIVTEESDTKLVETQGLPGRGRRL